ncbi:unnamed protein product [Urochloa humidicola]
MDSSPARKTCSFFVKCSLAGTHQVLDIDMVQSIYVIQTLVLGETALLFAECSLNGAGGHLLDMAEWLKVSSCCGS